MLLPIDNSSQEALPNQPVMGVAIPTPTLTPLEQYNNEVEDGEVEGEPIRGTVSALLNSKNGVSIGFIIAGHPNDYVQYYFELEDITSNKDKHDIRQGDRVEFFHLGGRQRKALKIRMIQRETYYGCITNISAGVATIQEFCPKPHDMAVNTNEQGTYCYFPSSGQSVWADQCYVSCFKETQHIVKLEEKHGFEQYTAVAFQIIVQSKVNFDKETKEKSFDYYNKIKIVGPAVINMQIQHPQVGGSENDIRRLLDAWIGLAPCSVIPVWQTDRRLERGEPMVLVFHKFPALMGLQWTTFLQHPLSYAISEIYFAVRKEEEDGEEKEEEDGEEEEEEDGEEEEEGGEDTESNHQGKKRKINDSSISHDLVSNRSKNACTQ